MEVQEEILLSPEEVKLVSEKAKYSLMMHNPAIIGQFTKNWWDVAHISPFKKLLFIEGQRFTGLEHINMRHRYYTNEHSPISGGYVITSRFAPDAGTLNDYSRLAEFLYDEKYKVIEKNKRPEIFDVYQAKVEFKERLEYCLIVYKNSKIVHTLFPIEKNKVVKKFKKHNFFVEYSEFDFIRGFIPYTDKEDILRFGIGICFTISEGKEVWSGLAYNGEKYLAKIEFGEMRVEYKFGIEKRIEALNYSDLTKHENVIINKMKEANML